MLCALCCANPALIRLQNVQEEVVRYVAQRPELAAILGGTPPSSWVVDEVCRQEGRTASRVEVCTARTRPSPSRSYSAPPPLPCCQVTEGKINYVFTVRGGGGGGGGSGGGGDATGGSKGRQPHGLLVKHAAPYVRSAGASYPLDPVRPTGGVHWSKGRVCPRVCLFCAWRSVPNECQSMPAATGCMALNSIAPAAALAAALSPSPNQVRMRVEAAAMQSAWRVCPDHVPRLHLYDPHASIMALELLPAGVVKLVSGLQSRGSAAYPQLAEQLSDLLARLLFASSDLVLSPGA